MPEISQDKIFVHMSRKSAATMVGKSNLLPPASLTHPTHVILIVHIKQIQSCCARVQAGNSTSGNHGHIQGMLRTLWVSLPV